MSNTWKHAYLNNLDYIIRQYIQSILYNRLKCEHWTLYDNGTEVVFTCKKPSKKLIDRRREAVIVIICTEIDFTSNRYTIHIDLNKQALLSIIVLTRFLIHRLTWNLGLWLRNCLSGATSKVLSKWSNWWPTNNRSWSSSIRKQLNRKDKWWIHITLHNLSRGNQQKIMEKSTHNP